MPRISRPHLFWFSGAFALSLVFLVRGERHLFYWFGPHEYWATHWARDYSDGFARRGLLGEIIALLGGDNTSYALITIGSWVAALGLAAVAIDAMWRLTRRMGQWDATLLTMAVLISPATFGILLETLGDPLQLILLVYILAARFILPRRNLLIIVPVFALLGLFMSLTHEASVFFVLPALGIQALVLRRNLASWAAFGACLATSAVIVAILMLTNMAEPPTSNPVLHLGNATFIYEGKFDSFDNLLSEELVRMFGSGFSGLFETAARVSGAIMVPLFLGLMVIGCRYGASVPPTSRQARILISFALVMLAVFPLMLIAHDWARFFGYILLVFLATIADTTPADDTPSPMPGAVGLMTGGLLLAGLTTTDKLDQYRMDGLWWQPRIMLTCLLVFGLTALFIVLARADQSQSEASSRKR
ncbi:hypothetical protein [Hyphomonas adhaerens]|uniref:hypothetical protein n=1 Tax=Hyphomonas adhaerens TaxID=81029 RepID=UPI00235561D0|nr:hypothetical protein [Hyphomonas adhaerens]|tara:strand:+ start:37388 stop:38641 length:1254 start_codon:yes stop_codon:yes gene_type:complete